MARFVQLIDLSEIWRNERTFAPIANMAAGSADSAKANQPFAPILIDTLLASSTVQTLLLPPLRPGASYKDITERKRNEVKVFISTWNKKKLNNDTRRTFKERPMSNNLWTISGLHKLEVANRRTASCRIL